MAILDYGNALRGAPNPLGNAMGAANQMQGLMQNRNVLNQQAQQQQVQQQQAAAQQQAAEQKQMALQQGADLLMGDDYAAQADFMFKNPDVAKDFIGAMNFKDGAQIADRIEFNKSVISSTADPVAALQGRIEEVRAKGGNTENLEDTLALGDPEEIRNTLRKELNFLDAQSMMDYDKLMGVGGDDGKTADQKYFEYITEGMSDDEILKSKKIDVGLLPRAMGNALTTAIESGGVDDIADAQAQIKQATKFAEATGASRAKIIDKGFEKITKINSALGNIDRAIEAVDAGAGVGAIEKKFPSLRAASVALDQIQGEMALDVIGSTTFGALSEGELNLAKSIALPTGLNKKELKAHLIAKKEAQEKLRDYFNDQIQFLDGGGTVAGFLREKERQQQNQTIDLSTMSDEELFN